MVSVTDVFGIDDSKNVLSHVKRTVENEISLALSRPNPMVIFLYGSSKQGKSSLVRSALQGQYIRIECASNLRANNLYERIFNRARIIDRLFWQGQQPHELIHNGVVDVDMLALQLNNRFPSMPILIDNFHYISPEQQKQFSTDTRQFSVNGVKLIIVGTWKIHDFLVRFNQDLALRSQAFPIEPWDDADLDNVLLTGAPHLNIEFTEQVRNELVKQCEGSVSLLQRTVLEFLTRNEHISATLPAHRLIDNRLGVQPISQGFGYEYRAGVLQNFKDICTIGEAWTDKKPRIYWMMQTFLHGSKVQITDGYVVDKLYDDVNKFIKQHAKQKTRIELAIFRHILQHELLLKQQEAFRTPIIAYDDHDNKLIVLDAQVIFALKYHRDWIRGQLKSFFDRKAG